MLDESEEPLVRSDKFSTEDKLNSISGGRIGTAVHALGSSGDILQSLGIQTLTMPQINGIIAGMQLLQRSGFQLYQSSLRGSKVSVWRLNINQPVNTLEVYRAYSRFCAAHPNVCAVMGICVEPLDTAVPMDEDSLGSPVKQVVQQQPWQQQTHQDTEEAGCILWVVEESHGNQTLAARVEQGFLSWQHCIAIAQDIGSALAYLQSLRRICPLAADAGAEVLDSNALAAPLSPLAIAQMLVLDNVQVNPAATAKISLVPAMLTQLEFALCVAPDAQRVAAVNNLLLPYIHPSSMFSGSSQQGSQSFDGTYSLGITLLQLLTERSAPGLLGTVQSALQQCSLYNLVPRTPTAVPESEQIAVEFAHLALRCCNCQPAASSWPATQPHQQQQPVSLDQQLLPALQQLSRKLENLGTAGMSWEQVEELLMMLLQPKISSSDPTTRRWVRQDFKMRRKLFLEEVAKMAVEGPIHKIEVRRSRCFKDSVTTFSGKVGRRCWLVCPLSALSQLTLSVYQHSDLDGRKLSNCNSQQVLHQIYAHVTPCIYCFDLFVLFRVRTSGVSP